MKTVVIKTSLIQILNVPDDAGYPEIFDFLAEHQSFRDAFCGVGSDYGEFRIVDVSVDSEEILEG